MSSSKLKLDHALRQIDAIAKQIGLIEHIGDWGSSLGDEFVSFKQFADEEFDRLQAASDGNGTIIGHEYVYRVAALKFGLMMARVYMLVFTSTPDHPLGTYDAADVQELEKKIERARKL